MNAIEIEGAVTGLVDAIRSAEKLSRKQYSSNRHDEGKQIDQQIDDANYLIYSNTAKVVTQALIDLHRIASALEGMLKRQDDLMEGVIKEAQQ